MIDLFAYKKIFDGDGIIFSFSGPMSHQIIVSLGETIRQKILEDKDGNMNMALKVFSVFVEQAENIIHYSVEKAKEDSLLNFGIVTIGKRNNSFFINCGNKIPKKKEQQLRLHLNNIASMSKDELKVFYREKRKAKKEGDSKGAGIGFIEMAKKSDKPIEYNFQTIDEEFSFFSVEINL